MFLFQPQQTFDTNLNTSSVQRVFSLHFYIIQSFQYISPKFLVCSYWQDKVQVEGTISSPEKYQTVGVRAIVATDIEPTKRVFLQISHQSSFIYLPLPHCSSLVHGCQLMFGLHPRLVFSLSRVNMFTDGLLIHHLLRLHQSRLWTHNTTTPNPSPLLLPVSMDTHTLQAETHSQVLHFHLCALTTCTHTHTIAYWLNGP